jgi:uncharacterized protein (DUF111 family)
MRIAYFDCFAGISGDMALASLIDAGLNFPDFLDALKRFKFYFFSVSRKKIKGEKINATQVFIHTKKQRNYSYLDFLRILKSSVLPESIKVQAISTFKDLAAAEKKVHGVKTRDFHFEQLGEIDTLVDIVGTYLALDLWGIERVYFSRIRLARGGTFKHDGENLPLPGPAVVELLKGIPVEFIEAPYEYVTPTGAVLVKNLFKTAASKKLPLFKILSVGYGAGSKKFCKKPNFLRVIIGEARKSVT